MQARAGNVDADLTLGAASMLVAYGWEIEIDGKPNPMGEPEVGTWLQLSANPDAPQLRGVVARIARTQGDEHYVVSIMIPDAQIGNEEFMTWMQDNGDLGVMISDDQRVTL